jgi:ribosomal protein S18 acetylase RimI-like enzyme
MVSYSEVSYMIVQFPAVKLIELPDVRAFDRDVTPWLVLREAENCYVLGDLPRMIWEHDNTQLPRPRFFALKDHEQIVCAAILHSQGSLVMTWASYEMICAVVTQLHAAGVQPTSVFGPGYVSWQFARTWGELTGVQWDAGREERVYQLSSVRYEPPASGRLSVATPADDAFVTPWLAGFAREAHYEGANNLEEIKKLLYTESRLFIWRNPDPVGMAAWVSPTPHGGSINMVYVPAAARGQGHGKAVVAALARHAIAGGARYCFILTDTQDKRNNHLYQNIGARTVAELLQCTFKPAAVFGSKPATGTLNIITNRP